MLREPERDKKESRWIEPELNRFLRDVLHVFPKLLRFFFVQDHRSIIRRPGHINFHGYGVMPDLHFAMRNSIKVQCAITDPNKMHAAAPFTLVDASRSYTRFIGLNMRLIFSSHGHIEDREW